MPTSVQNFNFLAPLVTEIWRGTKIKLGNADAELRRPLADNFFTCSQYLQMPTSTPNFNFLAQLVSEI